MATVPEQEYENFIITSRYARWMPEEGRRETWQESVNRYMSHMIAKAEQYGWKLQKDEINEMYNAILHGQVLPSMRGIMTAGKALERDEAAIFNCYYAAIDDPKVFDEICYLLMLGCGIGFSVERQHINQLPEVAEELHPCDTVISVRDSKIGWASAIRQLISLLYSGEVPSWDLSKIRPAGTPLKTFGGRACLTGDTIVYKDRKKPKGYNEVTVRDLYDMERSQGFWTSKPNHFADVKIRSLDEDTGQFFRNNVHSVVYNGVAPIYEILTENGYRIKATGNHRFMRDNGNYDYVDNFNTGELIAVNGTPEKKTGMCVDCGCPITRRAIRCKPCSYEHRYNDHVLETTARQRSKCRNAVKSYCENCVITGVRFEVHHIDGDPTNNAEPNLVNLCSDCHQKRHAKERTFPDPYSHKYISYDTIISIEYKGEDSVYDLQMDGPNHNFVANGFISHNSGSAPLNELMQYIVEVFKEAKGRKLHSLECHDIVCKIAEAIIVAGVRRSACLSLSNLSDDRMRNAKSGQWYLIAPHRALANNSIAFSETPEVSSFMGCMKDLYDSKSGERGIFNKTAAKNKAEERGMRDYDEYGGNACMESILANCQNCNLTEAVIEPGIEVKELERRVRIATKLGTIQTLFTNYRYLRAIWQQRIENDRLLGVSLTGIMDDPFFSGRNKSKRGELGKTLQKLRQSVIDENEKCAKVLGIEPAAATTLVKPSGTASKVVGSSPGIHPRLFKQYIGNVRGALHDPTTQLMIDEGVPYEPDVHDPDRTAVFKFPLTSPKEARVMSDVGAIEQLQMAHLYRTNWCDGHNVSCTVHIGEDEWFDVQAWLWRYWDDICGYAFLPRDGHIYTQQPYEPVDDKQWKEVAEKFPENIRWERLGEYESADYTYGSQQRECTGPACAFNA